MIKREIHIFLTSIMFYTRIPCPLWVDHSPDYLNQATRYFPLVGWVVGGMYAGCIVVLSMFFSPLISIILGLAVSVLITGAFHEDGFTDMCDGFGGGWTRENILLIMKDSRVGTFGLVGLGLLLALKASSTYELIGVANGPIFILMIISSHALSRAMAVVVVRYMSYARDDDDQSKTKPVSTSISVNSFIIAITFALIPLMVLMVQTSPMVAMAVIPMVASTAYLMRYFKKWIGGYTGDCLGAVQQVTEVVFLLSQLILWKFI